jgi:hypothetical protein
MLKFAGTNCADAGCLQISGKQIISRSSSTPSRHNVVCTDRAWHLAFNIFPFVPSIQLQCCIVVRHKPKICSVSGHAKCGLQTMILLSLLTSYMNVCWMQTCVISNPTVVGTPGCETMLQMMMMQVVVTKLAGWRPCSCGWGQRQAGRLPSCT